MGKTRNFRLRDKTFEAFRENMFLMGYNKYEEFFNVLIGLTSEIIETYSSKEVYLNFLLHKELSGQKRKDYVIKFITRANRIETITPEDTHYVSKIIREGGELLR